MDESGDVLTEAKPARRCWRRRLLVSLVVIVLLAAFMGGGALLGARHEDQHWKPRYDVAVVAVAHWKSDSHTKGAESDTWQKSSRMWEASSQTYEGQSQKFAGQLHDLQAKITTSVGDLNNPRFVLWNSCGAGGPFAGCSLAPGFEYVGGVPDTFTYLVNFTSTVPVTVWIMSTSNFVCWETHLCAWTAVGWENRTALANGIFRAAEGCAGYIAVFFSSRAGTLYPDVRVTRRPAAHATGVCK
jgi:hypothetical protein